MFWENKVPSHELTTSRYNAVRFNNEYWPHGFQHWETPTSRSIRYVVKYINKDQGADEHQGHLAMSKNPPIGSAYFKMLAEKYVRQGIAPQDETYRFPEAKRKDGSPKEFFLSGATLRDYIEHFKATWREVYPTRHIPYSPMIEKHDDAQARGTFEPAFGAALFLLI